MTKNSFHVIPSPHGGWAVKKGKSSRASRNFDTQEDAIAWGKKVSRNEAAEIVIHRTDGTIRSRGTYGSDPQPPRDSAKPAKRSASTSSTIIFTGLSGKQVKSLRAAKQQVKSPRAAKQAAAQSRK